MTAPDLTPARIAEMQSQLDQNFADRDLTQEEYDEGNAMLRGLRERDELRVRVAEMRAEDELWKANAPDMARVVREQPPKETT